MRNRAIKRLSALLLCAVMLLSYFAGITSAAELETAQGTQGAVSSSAAAFDVSVLDKLAYTDGTVSAWLECDGGNGIMTEGTNKSYLQVAAGTTYKAFKAYCKEMSQNTAYVNVYTDNSYGFIGGSGEPVTYARYKAVDGSHTVYTYILSALNEVRVIVDTQADMAGEFAEGYLYNSTTGETAQPMMVMYGLSMAENGYHIDTTAVQYSTDKVNSGALVVIRMPDNSLFIHDGGSVEQWSDAACANFMQFIREMTGKDEGEKVVINTWFISHAHTDHFQGMPRFIAQYHDQIDIKNVMYNIDSERLDTARDMTAELQMVRMFFPAVKYYKPHTGERFTIEGIEFDVLFTQEDRFYPTSNGQSLIIDHLDGKSEYAAHGSQNGSYRDDCFKETTYSYDETLVRTDSVLDYSDFNDTSTVLKVTFPTRITGASEDMTSILYADSNRVDQTMLRIYDGTDTLKTDIMMVPHHGHDAHPELVQVSEADVFLYTQKQSAIYGPNGIVDYGVDVGGTYRPALVYNYMAMQPYFGDSVTYWQGDVTVCMTFGKSAANLPSGMSRDKNLSTATGIYAYTREAMNFKYEGWTVLDEVVGRNQAAKSDIAITTKRIRFDQVTSLENEGRYMIVHDQSDRVLMYSAVAGASGQAKPNMAISMEVGSGQEASDGLVEAYYKVTDSSRPDVETKTSIYCTRDKRDQALWILGQKDVSGATALNTATAKFGGTVAYSTTQFYKGTTSDDAYWYSVSGKDYGESDGGNQWRYLRPYSSPAFYKSQSNDTWIEFFDDGTCLIYGYSSNSSIRFLTVTPEGNWVRTVYKKSEVTGDVLNSLKLRLYEYKTRSGAKTIAYSGPMDYEVLLNTSQADVINSIAHSFSVVDSSARNRAIPCSGTTAKVGYYWLDGTVKTNKTTSYALTVKYRNDDGTDSEICKLNIRVMESVYLDTVVSGTEAAVFVNDTATGLWLNEVYHSTEGYVGAKIPVELSMLTDADGNAVSAARAGTYTDLTLTYDGRIIATGISLTVQKPVQDEEDAGYETLFGGNYVSDAAEVTTVTDSFKYTLVTAKNGPAYNERFVIVHDKTNQIMSYSAVAQTSGQTAPNTAVSIQAVTKTEAKEGAADAYFGSTVTANGDYKNLFLNHQLRDETLWILKQTKKASYGTADIAKGDTLSYTSSDSPVKVYLGGDKRYHHSWFYKGYGPVFNADGTVESAGNGMYWDAVDGADEEGKQWRFLCLDEADLFGIGKATTQIESFPDDTFVLYHKDGSTFYVLTVNEDGTWGYRVMTAKEAKANIDDLKIRLYQYELHDGERTLAYEGMQDYYVPVKTAGEDVLAYIQSNIAVTDTGLYGCVIPCSGTEGRIAHYWLDADFDTGFKSEGTVDIKYRNDDGTDTVIGTVNIHIA